MNRRQFVKRIFAASFVAPFLLEPKKGASETGGELFLISDAPQRQLGLLLEELRAQGLIRKSSYSWKSPHPHAEEMCRALAGWKLEASGGEAGISFRRLDAASRPSFTLVRNGRIVDLRPLGLMVLWNEMQSSRPAAGLTIVSFKDPASEIRPGTFVSISLDGKKIDRVSLESERTRRYTLGGGYVAVRIEGGRARVESSSCRHQICVSSTPVSYAGERIICAPNRFLIEIEGKRFVDSVIG